MAAESAIFIQGDSKAFTSIPPVWTMDIILRILIVLLQKAIANNKRPEN